MNITLAGVAQRVREIGIRIAIGTRGRDVLKQILAESVTLGVLGGLAGLGVGIAASGLLTWLNGWPTKVTFGTIAIALLCSTGVAVVSGFYPARTAARLLPVQTLRMD
jgi:putative ABC transport system permease protein